MIDEVWPKPHEAENLQEKPGLICREDAIERRLKMLENCRDFSFNTLGEMAVIVQGTEVHGIINSKRE